MKRTSIAPWMAVALCVTVAGCATEAPTHAAAPVAASVAADRSESKSLGGGDDRDNEDQDEGDGDGKPFSYAVIGDFPYGAVKRAELPSLIALINADPAVERVLHAGDIKAGSSSPCTDAYFADIKGQFDTFQDPLVYTPGDNEWTDCHVALKNNGLYLPTERLDAVRALFFPVVGKTLGVNAKRVTSQGKVDKTNAAYIENVMWERSGVVFASLNITGSNDDTAPWASTPPAAGELPGAVATWPAQLALQGTERASRTKANNAWLDRVFARARDEDDTKAVVLLMQADMWDGTLANRATTISAYDDMVVKIGTLAAKFKKPVLLLEGDSHVFRVDQPYTLASPLFGLHPNTPVAPNVTRMVVNGSGSRTEYVRLTIDPRAKGVSPFTFVEVPLP